MSFDEIIDQVNPLGLFQILHLLAVIVPKALMGWSMMMMSYAGVAPDWWCVPKGPEGDIWTDWRNSTKDNTTFQICKLNTSQCNHYFGSNIDTIVNEWDLVCDKELIKSTVTSIQMAGVLFGSFFSGQCAEIIGRKKTFILTLVLHGFACGVAGLSVSWEMFAVLRFIVGFMIGCYFVVSFVYSIEFIGLKYRPIIGCIPSWQCGISLFALCAWQLRDWRMLHYVCAAMHIPLVFCVLFTPESPRWLVVHSRVDEAERVVEVMCKINRRPKPSNCREVLNKIEKQEKCQRDSGANYTYLDVCRGWNMFQLFAKVAFIWAMMALTYYGLSFGVEDLSGNLFLNIFLMSVVEIPMVVLLIFIVNKFGRKWTALCSFSLASAGGVGVFVSTFIGDADKHAVVVTVLALLVKVGISAGWGSYAILTGEIYPTVIRTLGFGTANTAARVGGIIAPFIFALEKGSLRVPFGVIAVVNGVSVMLTLTMRETKGTPLEDTIEGDDRRSDAEDNVQKSDIPGQETHL